MTGDIILSASSLTKEFRGFTAVNGVDLQVRRGTIHALIGPNGAGKTTCFNLLTKFLAPTRGSIAGSTKKIVFQLASLTDVHWSMSGEVVLMTLVGGLGTVFGPIAGALVIVSMQNYLASPGAWVTVVQGAIFVLCVLLFRAGILGLIAKLIRKPL